jgi:hypothetical protein
MNNNFKIVALICGAVVLMFVLYFTLFSDHARCVNSYSKLAKNEGERDTINMYCVSNK